MVWEASRKQVSRHAIQGVGSDGNRFFRFTIVDGFNDTTSRNRRHPIFPVSGLAEVAWLSCYSSVLCEKGRLANLRHCSNA